MSTNLPIPQWLQSSTGPALAVLGLLMLGACASVPSIELADPQALVWPSESPRVRLERVIGNRGGSRTIFERLVGHERGPIFHRPYGVAWDGDDLLVADAGSARLIRIDSRGAITESADGLFEGLIGVAACPVGIVATDSRIGRVSLFDRELHLVRHLQVGLDRPTGVTCRGRRIFVTETGHHRVVILDLAGADAQDPLVERWGRHGRGNGEFNYPTALALSRNSLLVGDTLNFQVQVLDLESGGFVGSFGNLGDSPGELPRLKDLAVDARGDVWISDAHLDQVSLFGGDGTYLLSIGRSGGEIGEFSFPAGVAAHPDGRVAVVDSLNQRLVIFRLVEAQRG